MKLSLLKIIKEFDISSHSKIRMNLRFFNQTSYDVVAFNKNNPNNKIIIGKYNIPQDAKHNVNNILSKISDPDYNVSQEIALVIQLYEFKMKSEYINFIGTPEEQIKFKKVFADNQNYNIFLQTPMDERGKVSHGRFLVCVARGNVISTAFLLHDTNMSFEKLKEVMLQTYKALNDVIYINNPETQLDTYIDVEKAKLTPPKNPQTPTEQPPPQMSNKEKRLQDYKERMKKLYGGKK